jgi:hypothetical protein
MLGYPIQASNQTYNTLFSKPSNGTGTPHFRSRVIPPSAVSDKHALTTPYENRGGLTWLQPFIKPFFSDSNSVRAPSTLFGRDLFPLLNRWLQLV